MISVRGNWPLVPTMDVVVPHTRTMADMFEVLDVIVADDPRSAGDLWRMQPWIPIPPIIGGAARLYRALLPADAAAARHTLWRASDSASRSMYINCRPGGRCRATVSASVVRPASGSTPASPSSIFFQQAVADLIAAGADVVLVDFPVVSNYECDRAGAPSIERGAW